jgi:hypothetical protein
LEKDLQINSQNLIFFSEIFEPFDVALSYPHQEKSINFYFIISLDKKKSFLFVIILKKDEKNLIKNIWIFWEYINTIIISFFVCSPF